VELYIYSFIRLQGVHIDTISLTYVCLSIPNKHDIFYKTKWDVEQNHNKYVCKTLYSRKPHGSDAPTRQFISDFSCLEDGLLGKLWGANRRELFSYGTSFRNKAQWKNAASNVVKQLDKTEQRPSESRDSTAEQPNAVMSDMFYESSPTAQAR
jgi:hypothetical protein